MQINTNYIQNEKSCIYIFALYVRHLFHTLYMCPAFVCTYGLPWSTPNQKALYTVYAMLTLYITSYLKYCMYRAICMVFFLIHLRLSLFLSWLLLDGFSKVLLSSLAGKDGGCTAQGPFLFLFVTIPILLLCSLKHNKRASRSQYNKCVYTDFYQGLALRLCVSSLNYSHPW